MKKKILLIPTLVLASTVALSSCSSAIFRRNNMTYAKFLDVLKDPQNPKTSAKEVVYLGWNQNEIRQPAPQQGMNANPNNTFNNFSYAVGAYDSNDTPTFVNNNDSSIDLTFKLFYDQAFITLLNSISLPAIHYSSNLYNYLEVNKLDNWAASLFSTENNQAGLIRSFYESMANGLLTGNETDNYIFTPIDIKFEFKELTPELTAKNGIYDPRAYNVDYKLKANEIEANNLLNTSNYLTKLFVLSNVNISFAYYIVGLNSDVAPTRDSYITSTSDVRFQALANKFQSIYKHQLTAPVFNLKLNDLGVVVRYNVEQRASNTTNAMLSTNPADYVIRPTAIDSIIPLKILSNPDNLVYQSGNLKDQRIGFKQEWNDSLVDLSKILSADQYINTQDMNADTLTNQISNIRQNTGLFFNLLSNTHFRIINQNDVVDNNAFGANLAKYYNWYFDKLTQVEDYSKIDLVPPNNDPQIKTLMSSSATDMKTEMMSPSMNEMKDGMSPQSDSNANGKMMPPASNGMNGMMEPQPTDNTNGGTMNPSTNGMNGETTPQPTNNQN
ncbi:hypothetical protein [Mycoplasma tullyi]|uniref:hypothetical protein n=1 Tax=Mycoplasma tullyi TaxID=1612150 RepID=UPI001E64324F|nr:hypothetical protein [Mycoplasma tullyi]